MNENQGFELPNEGNPSERGSDSLKNRLQKGATLLLAFSALAGEACSPDKGNEGGQTGDRSKSVEVQKEQMKPNSVLLAEYYDNIKKGSFPSKGQSQRTMARALEITIQKGIRIGKGTRVRVEARGTVPVKIEISDGDKDEWRVVPVGSGDYTKPELDLVKLVEGISRSMGNTPDRNAEESSGVEEKISPLADRVFNKSGKSSKSGTGGKIYTSPDFEDFLDNGNKSEKRKSKSEF